MKWPAHGGQPEKMYSLTGLKQDKQVYDFSANLNPLGPPEAMKLVDPQILYTSNRYPDPDYLEATRQISLHEGVSKHNLLATNGGAEAIFLTAQFFSNKKALILEPTFSEYRRACSIYNLTITTLTYDEKNEFSLPMENLLSTLETVDVVFLCRPNNPTGTMSSYADMKQIIEHASTHHTAVVVDEAFIHFVRSEFEDLTSLQKTYDNLILLRSLTKIFSIPGLRLGYVIAHEKIIRTLKGNQIPWSINSVVINLLPTLFKDQHFIKNTKVWLEQQLAYLSTELRSLDFYITPSVANFYLLKDLHQDQANLLNYLLEHGIIPRHTHTFIGLDGRYLRFAVRTEEENHYLLHVLKMWRENR
ncbi:threonine-phosphate decarboxylase CobD [Bacillus weihaiensis]|uniref:threonine-phosphate decarboxylase n=1 Tax=Bacillus weihaiensis TaxID=1547283 RepID=A0A1L3MRT3_9BACI|nr:threonine-phosphate decarboxylase CobD [Bacillus weihaiensis]APH05058.1 threonine-phosphate decarboxylase [Bacillus weihaiensis]